MATPLPRLPLALVLILLSIPALEVRARAEEPGPAPAPADAEAPPPAPESDDDPTLAPKPPIQEHVSVHASRLADVAEPVASVPAHVTVLTAEDIARSGARTLQDLLALEVGVGVFDQVGNDVEKTLDLRGFAGGSGTAVFLDGVRLNDPRNNAVSLETVPIDAIDRLEITRGSAAGLTGAGAEAGIVHLRTRRGGPPGGSVTAEAGSDGALNVRGTGHGTWRRVELFASASHDHTDGFRENADGDLDRAVAGAGLALGGDRRLDLTAIRTGLDFGAPGALTPAELEADPGGAPYNRLDGSRSRGVLASLAYQGPLGGEWSVAAVAYGRGSEAETLTTGRAAAAGFGGFFLDADTRVRGATAQVTQTVSQDVARRTFTAGLEWSDGQVDALGWQTPPEDLASHEGAPLSDNSTRRRTFGIFARQSWSPTSTFALHAGLRTDRDRIAYRETLPGPAREEAKVFSETTWRGGVTWNPTPHQGGWVTYARSFLPPTTEQLFAFPLFGSNEDLDPEIARTMEVGWRGRGVRGPSWTAAAFRADTSDEVVFDPDFVDVEQGVFFGQNRNMGETRRDGIELGVRWRPLVRLACWAGGSLVDAEFRSGEHAGKRVPLVPRHRASAGLAVDLTERLVVRAHALHVGSQVLDNDDANAQERLDAYTVADAGLEWRARPWLQVHLQVRNVFDESYATRGIFAFDFVALTDSAFLSPAPGRRWFGGATVTF